jgi:hypothetical protein
MTRMIFATTLLFFAIPSTLAGTPPREAPLTRADMEGRCAALGAEGERLVSGCRNAETGAALVCDDRGCTEHFADPRYARIRALLDQYR